ncbi:MAG: hypothetical protein V1721_00895 [Pseudomonadota bacterium]
MKKLATGLSFLAIIAGLAFSATALAAKKPIDYRRTLFVPVGQKTLMLEAPQGMCFLDQTSSSEGLIHKTFSDLIQKKGDQVLLAVFADCNSLANYGGTVGLSEILFNTGVVTWMNPSIGESTPMSRQDYLDMREASFRQYAENGAGGLGIRLDENTHRTESNVSLGMSGEVVTPFEKFNSTGVLATTTLRHIPIEVMLRFTRKDPPPIESLYPLMDKFMAQQIALNE